MKSKLGLLLLAFTLSGFGVSHAQNLKEFEKKVTKFTLDNGLRVIVIERHDAPVASFLTYVNAGSVDEPIGKSGIAHIFEHMAFKGSTYIGTKDATKEAYWLDQTEDYIKNG